MPRSTRNGTCSKPPQEQGSLVQGKNCECSRNNPADRVRKPWPAILVGVETNVAIGGAKLPFPEPIRFLAGTVHQPVNALQPGRYRRHHITKSHYSQRSDPATLLIISGEDWPTAIRVLGVRAESPEHVRCRLQAPSRVRARSSTSAQLLAAKTRQEQPSLHTGAVVGQVRLTGC